MTDRYQEFRDTPHTLARRAAAITPADEDLAEIPKAVWVGGAGDVVVTCADDTEAVTLRGVPAGSLLPVRPKRIGTGTTATHLVALY